jgi:large subunit ribosomal protein L10
MCVPTSEKQRLVAEIKERLQSAGGVIMADYRGLTVKAMRALRSKLREAGAEITVYKNSLTEIAIRDLGLPSMDEFLEGPTALVFTPEDPVSSAKAMMEFARENKAFSPKGGYIDGAVVSADQIKAIASLPSREELIAKLMGSMLNPVRGFMSMANAPAGALARVLKAVADQKAAA